MYFHHAIRPGDARLAAELSRQLPEFSEPYGEEEIAERLHGVPHLVLIAFVDEQPAGFKVGYERDGYFYSWLGGVLPGFRRHGIAQSLADAQEAWAREQGYGSVTFKTRNRHKAMLAFALRNGFDIVGFEEREEVGESRIWLRKGLSS